MKLRLAETELIVGYEVVAAMTAVLLLDRSNRVICCVAAALLHELGHIFVMRLKRVRIRAVRLRLFDALIEADAPACTRDDLLITLGGPMMNLLCCATLFPMSSTLALPHMALCVFNLLPVMSLDGGHVAEIILQKKFNLRTVSLILRLTTFLFLLPLLTAGVYLLLNSGYNYSLLAISLYLLTILLLKN